ncbi:MAG: ferritin-like domain-containing protein [Arenimonas sp.]
MNLFTAARACIRADAIEAKLALTADAAAAFARGALPTPDDVPPPEPISAPGRPTRPELVAPRDTAHRGLGSAEGRAAFVHAIAHIEFNAIDLAWDAAYRFRGMPPEYYADWVGIAADEARHFALLQARLAQLGHAYGDFPAHNGLWEMATSTADSLVARMALVPRVLEARGLDVTPGMIVRLRGLGDDASADILALILEEEVAHVAAGSRWFAWGCAREGLDPVATFGSLLAGKAKGAIRGPFNRDARHAAGFGADEMILLERLGGPR